MDNPAADVALLQSSASRGHECPCHAASLPLETQLQRELDDTRVRAHRIDDPEVGIGKRTKPNLRRGQTCVEVRVGELWVIESIEKLGSEIQLYTFAQ